MPPIEPEMVTDQKTLEDWCRVWREAGIFAFDTEFIRDDTYDAALCLIQVTTNGTVVLVDPTGDVDVSVFWELVTDESVVTIVHAGKEDFEVCLRKTGRVPRNVFDVQIAAGFVGYGYPLSLTRLVERIVHRRIIKGQTLTDWLRRPLTEAQIRYAVEDVVHLPEVYRCLLAEIESAGRLEWAREEFKCFEDPECYHTAPVDRSLKLRGSKKLDGLGLLLLARLVGWREQWAQSRNRPPRAMMRDDVIVEIAKRRPHKEADLEVMRGFPQARNRKVIQELLDIISAASAAPKSEWPKPHEHREETPMTKAILDLLSAMVQATCHKEHLSRNLLGGAQRLRALLDHHAGRGNGLPELRAGWREEFIGRRLIDLLEGRSEIHLSGWPDDPQVEVVSHPPTKKKRRGP